MLTFNSFQSSVGNNNLFLEIYGSTLFF